MTNLIIPMENIKGFVIGAVVSLFIIAAVGSAIAVISADNSRITNLATPTASTDAATKAYVDAGSLKPANWTCTIRTASVTDSLASSYICNPTASCTGSEKVVSGGCAGFDVTDLVATYQDSFPTNQGWSCYWRTTTGPCGVTAYANCCV